MAEKDVMMSTANGYASKAEKAGNCCKAAKKNIDSTLLDVESYWWGNAGETMRNVLEAVSSSLNDIGNELLDVGSSMRTQAANTYNSWPEEEEKTDNE